MFKASSPSGQITNSLQVTNSYAQKLIGTVSDGANPVPNAVVLLLPASGRPKNAPIPGTVANDLGFYSLPAPVGTYALGAIKNDFVGDWSAATNVVLTSGQTLSTNLSLIAATESISGNVIDAATSSGLPGVLLDFHTANLWGFCYTDTIGYFTAGVTANQWTINGEDAAVALLRYVGLGNGLQVSTTNGSVSNLTIADNRATALFYLDPAHLVENFIENA